MTLVNVKQPVSAIRQTTVHPATNGANAGATARFRLGFLAPQSGRTANGSTRVGVVGPGVDPGTFRFSGGRSAD